MRTEISRSNTSEELQSKTIEDVLIKGNLATLPVPERVNYYLTVCKSLGLNPLTKPFEYLSFQGKMVLYAKRECTEQLRRIHSVSIDEIKTERFDNLFVATAYASSKDKKDSDVGAVDINNLKGVDLANAIKKAVTQAKRRVTLSICGLGMLDESETEDVGGAKIIKTEEAHKELKNREQEEKKRHNNIVNTEPVTKKQLDILMTAMRKSGWTAVHLADICQAKFGIHRSVELNQSQFAFIYELVLSYGPDEGTKMVLDGLKARSETNEIHSH